MVEAFAGNNIKKHTLLQNNVFNNKQKKGEVQCVKVN